MSDDEPTAAAPWSVKSELCAVGRDKPLLAVLAAILCLYCAFIAGPIVYAILGTDASVLDQEPPCAPNFRDRSTSPRNSRRAGIDSSATESLDAALHNGVAEERWQYVSECQAAR
ncbi:hypothetical protein NKH10_26760 [Mesorhizobium sp. M1340]|uniref:hypothetical protein n=1 Tax=unclassified Mesorhizobium TaxID=325217 RepID=UPI0033351A07